MRLKKVTQIDPIERMAVSVRSSSLALLEKYRAHYEATYGEPIERSHLVEQMLLDYLTGDKDFQKALQRSPNAKPSTPSVD